MLPSNVVEFKKQGDRRFPDLFPIGSYNEVILAASRNVPASVEKAVYHYVLKEDISFASPVSFVVGGGVVLINPCSHFGDNKRLNKWAATHLSVLKKIGKSDHKPMTVVGKIRLGVFSVMYIIDEEFVYFDDPSLDARLNTYGGNRPFGDDLTLAPILERAELVIDHKHKSVHMQAIDKYVNSRASLVGFPVTEEERESKIPRLFASSPQMRSLAFVMSGG